jgi:WXG100 family type VII secretion target
MSEPFRVDPDALHDAVARMAEFQRDAESVLSEIDSLVTNLHATWSGRAAAAHAEGHRHWARGQAMMRAALAQLRPTGATAHANYTGCDVNEFGHVVLT